MVMKPIVSTFEGPTPKRNLTAEEIDHHASLGRRIFLDSTAAEPNIIVMDGGRRGRYVHTGRFSFHWGVDEHEHTKKDHVLGVTYPSWKDPEDAEWSKRKLAEFDRDYNPVARPVYVPPQPVPVSAVPPQPVPASPVVVEPSVITIKVLLYVIIALLFVIAVAEVANVWLNYSAIARKIAMTPAATCAALARDG